MYSNAGRRPIRTHVCRLVRLPVVRADRGRGQPEACQNVSETVVSWSAIQNFLSECGVKVDPRLAELSQLRRFFGFFALICMVKPFVFRAAL